MLGFLAGWSMDEFVEISELEWLFGGFGGGRIWWVDLIWMDGWFVLGWTGGFMSDWVEA